VDTSTHQDINSATNIDNGESFGDVMRAHAAGDVETSARRLRAWDALGRRLAAAGWHHLEAGIEQAERLALDTVISMDLAEDPDAPERPIAGDELAALVGVFVADCRRLVTSGGAPDLQRMIAADADAPIEFHDLDGLDDLEPAACARLLRGAEVFALRALTTTLAYEDRVDARTLFGGEATADQVAATLRRLEPFARDTGAGPFAFLEDASVAFMEAGTNEARVTATRLYAMGMEQAAHAFTLRPVQRMGLIASVARLGIQAPFARVTAEGVEMVTGEGPIEVVEAVGADDIERWMRAGAALRMLDPARYEQVAAELRAYAALDKPTEADRAASQARLRAITAGAV
jgi:hypothetical protein